MGAQGLQDIPNKIWTFWHNLKKNVFKGNSKRFLLYYVEIRRVRIPAQQLIIFHFEVLFHNIYGVNGCIILLENEIGTCNSLRNDSHLFLEDANTSLAADIRSIVHRHQFCLTKASLPYHFAATRNLASTENEFFFHETVIIKKKRRDHPDWISLRRWSSL